MRPARCSAIHLELASRPRRSVQRSAADSSGNRPSRRTYVRGTTTLARPSARQEQRPLTPGRVVSAWPAIDDDDVDNSAMHVIGGTTTRKSLLQAPLVRCCGSTPWASNLTTGSSYATLKLRRADTSQSGRGAGWHRSRRTAELGRVGGPRTPARAG